MATAAASRQSATTTAMKRTRTRTRSAGAVIATTLVAIVAVGGRADAAAPASVPVSNTSPALNIAWGFGGSAYQIEGAWNVGGKGPSTYDYWFHNGTKMGNENGDMAVDHYNRLESDLDLLASLGATAYRFSVSWTRILPNCNDATPNPAGLDFYTRMIDGLLQRGIEPYLTMFHWDLPQACQDQYGGFLDAKIIDDFVHYADILFQNYGSKVRYWLTLNEAEANCNMGYMTDWLAPAVNKGRSAWAKCLYYSMMIHGRVVQLGRSKYSQYPLKFGLPAIISGFPDGGPDAYLDSFGRMFDPVVFGDWGDAAKQSAEGQWFAQVPFSDADKKIVANTSDFIALNYYSSAGSDLPGAYIAGDEWQQVYAPGFRHLLQAAVKHFPGIDIHVTEIGDSTKGNERATFPEDISDNLPHPRAQFWSDHLEQFRLAVVEDKLPIRSLLVWALFDNFEWITYSYRFGCIAVNFADGGDYNRTVKNSTYTISNFFVNSASPFEPPGSRLNTAITSTTASSAASAPATSNQSSGSPAATSGAVTKSTAGGSMSAATSALNVIVGFLVAVGASAIAAATLASL